MRDLELLTIYNQICSHQSVEFCERYVLNRKMYEVTIACGTFDVDYYHKYCTVLFCLPYFKDCYDIRRKS